jgi:DNA-binding MarR family transcriptional regulator
MSEQENISAQIDELAGIIARLSVQQMKNLMNETGLSHSQLITLMRLNQRGGCGISKLASHLGTTDAASSQLVQRLVNLDLVERTESVSDRREKIINLTPEGKKLVERVIESRRGLIQELVQSLPVEHQSMMLQAIHFLVIKARDYENQQVTKSEPVNV